MAETHTLINRKLHVYKRPRSNLWQCRTYFKGKHWRRSTGEESLSHAKEVAEDWYFELRGKSRAGLLTVPSNASIISNPSITHQQHQVLPQAEPPKADKGMTFKEAGEIFFKEYSAINAGIVSDKHITVMRARFDNHLVPYFGEKQVTELHQGAIQQFRVHRLTSCTDPKSGKVVRPANATVRQEVVVIRHVLSAAHNHGKLPNMPLIKEPYVRSRKVEHLAWFSPEDYKTLYQTTRRQIRHPKDKRYVKLYAELHDFVLFMTNTGLRVSEVKKLRFKNVQIVQDPSTDERILKIHVVDGKRGVGLCYSMSGAVRPFERLFERTGRNQDNLIFRRIPRLLLNNILNDLGLKYDYQGKRRTAGSFRHSYFCFRRLAGADLEELAKNGRTSVDMLKKFYLPHLEGYIDTSKINMKKTASWGMEPI